MQLAISPDALTAYLLAFVRATAWLLSSPPFNNRMVPNQVKVGFAAALTLAMAPRLDPDIAFETAPIVGAVVLQVGAGLALGFLTTLLFGAVQAAGNFVDLFGGFTLAQVFDPMTGAGASVFGRLYQLVAVAILFATNGHLLLVRGFITSFHAAPLTGISLESFQTLLTNGLGAFFLAAIQIAAPLLVALFLADIALGLLSRAAPQLNVLMLSLPLKVLLTVMLAGAALPLLPNAVDMIVHSVVRQIPRIFS